MEPELEQTGRVARAPRPPRRASAGVVVARCVGATFVYLAVLALLYWALILVGTLLPGARQGPLGLLGLGLAEGAALLSVVGVWRAVDRRPLAELGFGRLAQDPPWRQWLRGAGVGVLLMGLIVFGWFTLVDGARWSANPDLGRAMLALVAGFVGFLVQGPSEEVLFRGYILENVRARWGVAWGVGVSAVAFALLHAANPAFGLLPLLNLLLFGVATALYKLRVDGGQLWGVGAIHTLWNWLQEVVFGLPNSGNASDPSNTLFSIQPNTGLPDVVWGGGFGPEGTLAATLVLLGLIVALLRRRAGQTTVAETGVTTASSRRRATSG